MNPTESIAGAARTLDGAISRMVQSLVTPPAPSGGEAKATIDPFRAIRERTLELISGVSEDQAVFRPAPHSWSIAEVIDHLARTEAVYRKQVAGLIDLAATGKATSIELTLREFDASFQFIPREIIPLFAIPLKMANLFVPHAVREAIIRNPILPATSPHVAEPGSFRPFSELRATLEVSLAQTEALLSGGLSANVWKMTISHPILGTNTIPQIFQLMGAHEERHQKQIRSAMENGGFPRA